MAARMVLVFTVVRAVIPVRLGRTLIEPTLPDAELARPYGGRGAPTRAGTGIYRSPRKRTALGARPARGPRATRRQKGTGRGIHGHHHRTGEDLAGVLPPRIRTAAAHPRRLDVPAARLRGAPAVRDAHPLHRAARPAHHRLVRRRGRRRRGHGRLHGAVRALQRPAGRPLRPARGPGARRAGAHGLRSVPDGARAGARPLWALFVAAVPTGASVPQVGPMVRARWGSSSRARP